VLEKVLDAPAALPQNRFRMQLQPLQQPARWIDRARGDAVLSKGGERDSPPHAVVLIRLKAVDPDALRRGARPPGLEVVAQ
jgi:hypothetical protein